jgi:hypothetical protein
VLDNLGFGMISNNIRKNQPSHWKKLYRYRTSGQSSLALLKMIYPYLIIKKEQADIAIRFQEMGVPIGTYRNSYSDIHIFRYQCHLMLKGMKSRGVKQIESCAQ